MPRVSSKDKYTVQVFELFKRCGLSLNMEVIAQELGLTKKTLYNNYTCKAELINTVVEHFYNILEKEINHAIEESDNAIEAMFNVSSVVTKEISALGQIFLKDISQYHASPGIFAFTDRVNFYSKFIMKNLQRGVDEGLFRTNINMDYATIFYNSAIELFYRWDNGFKYFPNAAHYHRQLVKHHLYAVVNDKGREMLEKYL